MQMVLAENLALFLDFDGTLVDFASTPEGVQVSEQLREVLGGLAVQLNGALALVSGRSIDSLAGLLNLPLAMAGSHGAEWRLAAGPVTKLDLESESFTDIKAKLLKYAAKDDLIAEDKGHAVALHYRGKEHLRESLDYFIYVELGLDARTDVRVIKGNCVREIQPTGVDKGVAIAHFMGMEPFKGRQPVYIGDDTTDEDGFAWVNHNGGVSIKVGDGNTCAGVRLADTGEVFAFLQGQLDKLRQLNDRTQSRAGSNR